MDHTPHATDAPFVPVLAKHRFDALQDGVYAIAITLLVLELRLPGHDAIHSSADLLVALAQLIPKFIAWLVSFFVLALYWHASLRAQGWVRQVDTGLLWINVLSLMFASFLPFASSLVGEHPGLRPPHCVYAVVMAGMALTALWQLHHLNRHPEICHAPMPPGVRKAAALRIWGLLGTTLLALLIAMFDPRFATLPFMLMGVIVPVSARIEKRHQARA